MRDLEYQLVFEFAATTAQDFDKLQALEQIIETGISKEPGVMVDGHDFGMGFYNIFIHTNTPEDTSQKTLAIIHRTRPGLECRAGYRAFTGNKYKPLHPETLQSFELR